MISESSDEESHHIPLTCSEKIILISISLFTLILSSAILLHISSSTGSNTLDKSNDIRHYGGTNFLPIIQSILMESFLRFTIFLSETSDGQSMMKIFSRELRPQRKPRESDDQFDEKNCLIIFPKEISYNYENVSRIAGQKGNGPKIRNGHHCPYLGFRKHSHYQLSQTILSTLCYQNIEFKQYCNVETVKQDFNQRLSPQSLKGFNRDKRVRNHQFPQCCDNFDFQFNFKQRIEEGMRIGELEKIVPRAVLKQMHSVLLMSDLISYSELAKSVDWNSLHIFDFFHDEKSKKRILRWIPEILYTESKIMAALKFGLWSHQFSKYGTCVTNQIYENYVDRAFDYEIYGDSIGDVIDRRMEIERVFRSDPELYFDLMYLLHKRFDYFRKDKKVLLEYFPPSLTKAYRVSDIKAKIYELFGDHVMLSCAVSQNFTHPLIYQFQTCLRVEDVEPLAFYLIERKERYRRGDQSLKSQSLIKDPQILTLLDKIKSESCLVIPNFNKTEFNQHYFNNYTDMATHIRYEDDPNLQTTNDCTDEEFVLIPDTAELLKKFSVDEDGKIIEESETDPVFDFGFLSEEIEKHQQQEPINNEQS